jgi:predicted flap endonuclease-1-like 5' DNA nuclease
MEAQLNQRLKMAKTKERIRAKAEANALKRQMEQANTQVQSEPKTTPSEEELVKLFGSGEKAEKSLRGTKPHPSTSNKKKKGKK